MLDLGATPDGTAIKIWFQPGQDAAAMQGGAHLRDVFAWYETNLGPYLYGPEAGAVSVSWGGGAYGGMEHHPFWHTAAAAIDDEEVNAHEAAHGWFGDGIRIRCWEDFVLSEGTVTYLAARALEATAGAAVADDVWASYQLRLNNAMATAPHKTAWPNGGATCNAIDMLEWFSSIPYMKGAFFFRALETRIGRPALDTALAAFYDERKAQAAGMQDLLDTIETMSDYDLTACADAWLKQDALPAITTTCP